MDTRSTSAKRNHDMNLAYFKIRIRAKLCVGGIYILQAVTRTLALVFDTAMTNTSRLFLIISMPFCLLMPLIIAFEYLLFKKKGPGIVKYSNILDFVLLLVFLGDWSMSEISDLNRIQQTDPISFKIGALYGFTAFSWRTLMVTLIVQKWQLKIIAPSMAVLIAMSYCIYYNPSNPLWVLVRAITQLAYIILIVYCEDKVKWKLMLTNLQQEKWMQVNDFILNSIPENIMILNLAGETKFISEYCKSFIKKCNLSLEKTKDLFGKIRDLNQQYETDTSNSESFLNIERLTTCNGLLTENNSHQESYQKIEVLEDLITNFKSVIKHKNLQERQFLIYNGKLKTTETPPQPEKSIEVKISFVQHFENDYIILIFRDTTQRDLLVTLEETNKYKDQLLASVSHELRAPLNGNINLVESAVNSPKIPESVKETLLIPALRSSKFLLHIINDILDMSQIKEKKLRLIFQSGDLKETLKSTAQLIELQAQKKGIELVIELDPRIPKNFCTDHIRLSQIVLNLLTNAIKFTKEGAVKLIAAPVQGTSWFRITVEDSGIGMNQENLKKLFSSYTHIDFKGRQLMNPTGVGLGLNIAHNLAELLAPKFQQGIRVASIPNQGSIFSFTIENKEKVPDDEIYDLNHHKSANSSSCEEVADEAIQPMVFERLQTVGSPCSLPSAIPKAESQFEFLDNMTCQCPKVLIVDDNPFNTMALEAILSSLEIKCSSVYSGSSAIQKLSGLQSNACCGNKECKAYSVVFMDQEMPEMSGAETVREIKRLQAEGLVQSSVKVIGCTAHKAKEEVDKFLGSGLDSCIYKPVSIIMIKDILKGFLV